MVTHQTVMCQLVLVQEPNATKWSLQVYVHGVGVPLGPSVQADTAVQAAQRYGNLLWAVAGRDA